MALWLVRAGKTGTWEQHFLEKSRVYLSWDRLNVDLSTLNDRDALRSALSEIYPDAKPGKIMQNSAQIWAFAKKMNQGDWIALPSKFAPSIHVGEIVGDYVHNPEGPDPLFHYRHVRWIEQDIPRTSFDQDILYSLGAFSTICQIKRNDAERRVRAMAEAGWKMQRLAAARLAGTPASGSESDAEDDEATLEFIDVEQFARDQLSKHILARFKGHGMARLVGALLEAEGYTVHQPPEGPDRGIDLLAAPGPLGFGEPRIVVQVKSQDTPLDRPTLDQLIGTMSNVNADRGLLVCWGGFKSTVRREEAQQFFRVRLWDSDDLTDALLNLYHKLDESLKAEVPLKPVWALAVGED
ncbi:MAG: restriction endonuclease [Phycisphaerales bacterium]|nr:restriction endonuclease [Phycisphaerales bacterium]